MSGGTHAAGAARVPLDQPSDLAAALGAVHQQRLQLQVNTSGAWRTMVAFPRADELACAHVLTAGPLLAGASGPRVTLRITSDDGRQTVYSHWDAGRGWRGTAAAAAAAGARPARPLAGVDDEADIDGDDASPATHPTGDRP